MDQPPTEEEPAPRLPGLSGWLLEKCPEVTCLVAAAVFAGGGIAMLLSNPAGNGTNGDEYGPDAPLQGWVVIVGLLLLVVAALSALLAFLALWHRLFGRRR